MNRTKRFSILLLWLAIAVTAAAGCKNATTASDLGNGGSNGDTTGSSTVTHQGIEYEAVVQVMESFPVQLAGDVTVTNPGDALATIVFPDGCVALLRAYADIDAAPVWDQSRDIACTMALVQLDLAAGESRSFRTATSSAADILGDTHPDGTYRITVYLRPDGESVEIDAGEAALAIPR